MRSLALAPLLGLAAAQQQNCFYDFGNSSFNLFPYQAQNNYKVQDNRNNIDSANYTYYFNLCKNVEPLGLVAPYPWVYPACNCTYLNGAADPYGGSCLPGAQGPGFSPRFPYAPAFQVAQVSQKWRVQNQDLCHALGAPQALDATPQQSFLLVDVTNPSRGVGIKYTGGDSCGNLPTSPRRSLTVWLQCDDDVNNKPDDEPVFETGNCAYEVYIKTAYGCPVECGGLTANGKLCGGHGLCEFDTVLRNSKCFCNDGWTGKDCTGTVAPAATGLSTLASGLIVVCVFLAAALGFLGFLWYRISALRLDPAAYSSLRAGPEDDKSSLSQPSFAN